MIDEIQTDLFSSISDLEFARLLLADLHDDLIGKIARFRQLNDLSVAFGRHGSMIPGGETAFAAWTEARTSLRAWQFYCHSDAVPTCPPRT